MANGQADRARFPAIDAMRGIVMVLMVVDHAQNAFNPLHPHWDAASMYRGQELPLLGYLTRWITHLCAPTFVFLAGTSVAISVARQRERGVAERAIDGHLLLRGLFIAALDPFVISLLWGMQFTILQVLYAIGVGIALMPLLRRLPDPMLIVTALAIIGGLEYAIGVPDFGRSGSLPRELLLTGGFSNGLGVLYPLLPWLAMLLLGYVFGRRVARGVATPRRTLLFGGLAALAVFAVVRAVDGYGNLGLHRGDGGWLHWLHVSKYPPSLSFTALELGIMALLLCWLWAWQRSARWMQRPGNPLLVFGRTALFFYVLHLMLLNGSAWLSGFQQRLDLAWGWILSGVALVLLYPVCRWYDRYKQTHRNFLTRLL